MFYFLRAKGKIFKLTQFLAVFPLIVSTSDAFALGSNPPESNQESNIGVEEVNEKSVVPNKISDSHGIDYDIGKLLKWREKIQKIIRPPRTRVGLLKIVDICASQLERAR